MPNHVYNKVLIVTDNELIARNIVEHITCYDNNGNPSVDFRAIVPQPLTLFLLDYSRKEEAVFGGHYWGNWNSANWGTKWNAYESEIKIVNGTTVSLEFQTAWRPPRPVLKALSEFYPQYPIIHSYVIETCEQFGYTHWREGECWLRYACDAADGQSKLLDAISRQTRGWVVPWEDLDE